MIGLITCSDCYTCNNWTETSLVGTHYGGGEVGKHLRRSEKISGNSKPMTEWLITLHVCFVGTGLILNYVKYVCKILEALDVHSAWNFKKFACNQPLENCKHHVLPTVDGVTKCNNVQNCFSPSPPPPPLPPANVRLSWVASAEFGFKQNRHFWRRAHPHFGHVRPVPVRYYNILYYIYLPRRTWGTKKKKTKTNKIIWLDNSERVPRYHVRRPQGDVLVPEILRFPLGYKTLFFIYRSPRLGRLTILFNWVKSIGKTVS